MQLRSTHTLHTKHATNKQTIFIWTSEPMPLQDVLVTCLISSYFDRRAWGSLVEKAINGELEELEEPGLRLLHLRCVLDVLPAHLVGICTYPNIHLYIVIFKKYINDGRTSVNNLWNINQIGTAGWNVKYLHVVCFIVLRIPFRKKSYLFQ